MAVNVMRVDNEVFIDNPEGVVWIASCPGSRSSLFRAILWQCFGIRTTTLYEFPEYSPEVGELIGECGSCGYIKTHQKEPQELANHQPRRARYLFFQTGHQPVNARPANPDDRPADSPQRDSTSSIARLPGGLAAAVVVAGGLLCMVWYLVWIGLASGSTSVAGRRAPPAIQAADRSPISVAGGAGHSGRPVSPWASC